MNRRNLLAAGFALALAACSGGGGGDGTIVLTNVPPK